MPIITLWWVWVCFALVLGIAEVLLPGFIFLGFAIGAVGVGDPAGPWPDRDATLAPADLCSTFPDRMAGPAPFLCLAQRAGQTGFTTTSTTEPTRKPTGAVTP